MLSELVRHKLALTLGGDSDSPASPGVLGTASKGQDDEFVLRIPEQVADRVCMGHLYGMNDVLSDYLVQRTESSSVPMVVK